jgi:hypothetical protein
MTGTCHHIQLWIETVSHKFHTTLPADLEPQSSQSPPPE